MQIKVQQVDNFSDECEQCDECEAKNWGECTGRTYRPAMLYASDVQATGGKIDEGAAFVALTHSAVVSDYDKNWMWSYSICRTDAEGHVLQWHDEDYDDTRHFAVLDDDGRYQYMITFIDEATNASE